MSIKISVEVMPDNGDAAVFVQSSEQPGEVDVLLAGDAVVATVKADELIEAIRRAAIYDGDPRPMVWTHAPSA